MSGTKQIVAGRLLLAVGAVVALASAAGPLDVQRPLQALFAGGTLLMIGGAVLLRRSVTHAQQANQNGDTHCEAHHLLDELAMLANQWKTTPDAIDADQLHQLLQRFLAERPMLLRSLGFSRYADLMIRFAAAERALHRALSAASDEYPDEAVRSLVLASERLASCRAALPND